MKKIILVLFVFVSMGEIVSGVVGAEALHWICKPMIMITLAVYYFRHDANTRSTSVALAILFSFTGDIALMFESAHQLSFVIGLLTFLSAHIFYIMAYRQHQHKLVVDGLQGIQKIRFAFPIILAGSGLVVILYPVLGVLKLPVIVYALVLALMVLNALFRYGRTTTASFWMVFGGAILFMVSDSILALNKFLMPVPQASVLIMSSYILAQFLLIEGLCNHFKSSE
ncbi:MAG: lysoplasmalogenase [Cyclobacteriaceae bacterium]|jgi:uncharacterized membrane protein YhhN|nr:lysoplasmalogenase [Cyclobacteriaceae bacterium]MDH4295390.1 lysoplasmalogenase [Cyclobacteriaceae bacterium]MDH5249622.1 lysoplasmalogenase [Cyclobacteriaceae bacterium]